MEEEKKTNEEKTMFQKLKEETEKIINKVNGKRQKCS